jgi:hypothetical protein
MVIDAASSGWYVETPADIAAGGASTASGSPVDRDAVVAWFEAGGLNTGAAARETEIDAIADGLAAGLAQPWQFNMAIEDPQGALTNWTTPNTASVLVSTRNVPTAPNLPGMTSFFNPADLIAGGVWLRLTTAGRGDEPVAAGA